MFTGKYHIIFLLTVPVLFALVSFSMNEWFSETMPRHQLLQLPSMILLGIIAGAAFRKFSIRDTYQGLAILIFISASLIFWMLPRSVDYAVINKSFNRLMHFNMFIAGFLLMPVLRNIIFEVRIIFLGMMSAMILAVGITLKSFDILLCSSFTIPQQNETGFYLILAGLALFATTLFVFFKGISAQKITKSVIEQKPSAIRRMV